MHLLQSTLSLIFVSIACFNAVDAVPVQTAELAPPNPDDFTTNELVGDVPTNTITKTANDITPTITSVPVPSRVRTLGVFNRLDSITLSVVDETPSAQAISTTSFEPTPTAPVKASPTAISTDVGNVNEITSEFQEEPTAIEPDTAVVTSIASIDAPLEQTTDITLTSFAATETITAMITDAPIVIPTSESQTEGDFQVAEPQVTQQSSPVKQGTTMGRAVSAFSELTKALRQMLGMFGNVKRQS